MPYLYPRVPVLHTSLNCYANTLACLCSSVVVKYAHFQLSAMRNYQLCFSKIISPSVSLGRSFPTLSSFGSLLFVPEEGERNHVGKCFHLEIRADSPNGIVQNEDNQLDVYTALSSKEIQRREKIGLANKGKRPWNKDRKHSAETRERIKHRTIEAMKDPKVREKLSEYPHAHSDRSKARIQSSMRRIWAQRLKKKQLREKLYLSWAESIAKAAKKGGSGQQELQWDSYDMLKEDIAIQHLRRATERKMAKKMAKQQAEAAAQTKAEKMARHVQKTKQQERNAKARAEINRKTRKKSNEGIEELAIVQGLQLKARLKKILIKKLRNGQVCSQGDVPVHVQPASEKLDLDFIKSERMRREVSLADQIRDARIRRAESTAMTCNSR